MEAGTERFQELSRLMQALADDSVEYVLVGGLTMGAFGAVRATEEVVLVVRPEASNLSRLRGALLGVWADPELEEFGEADLPIRYLPPGGRFAMVLLARVGAEAHFEGLEAETLAVGGVPMRVATPATLDRLRRDAARSEVAED